MATRYVVHAWITNAEGEASGHTSLPLRLEEAERLAREMRPNCDQVWIDEVQIDRDVGAAPKQLDLLATKK